MSSVVCRLSIVERNGQKSVLTIKQRVGRGGGGGMSVNYVPECRWLSWFVVVGE